MAFPSYRRVLLKLSGEALAGASPEGEKKFGIDPEMLAKIASDIKNVHLAGIQICLVIGGGNIYRGAHGMGLHNIDRATSDHMGMLATVINGLALKNALEQQGVTCHVMSALSMPAVVEPYTRLRALNYLARKEVVVFVAGTGNPFFTTDTAAALRAAEIGCDLLLKATKCAGVFCSDPLKNPKASFLPNLTYKDVITQNLAVMDMTAITLVQENKIPVAVFSIYEDNGFQRVLKNDIQYSLIKE